MENQFRPENIVIIDLRSKAQKELDKARKIIEYYERLIEFLELKIPKSILYFAIDIKYHKNKIKELEKSE